MSYLNLATHQVLLRSYEQLALLHKRKNTPKKIDSSQDAVSTSFMLTFEKEEKIIDNYVYNFPLLSLNAAIIEGALRYVLSQNLRNEINRHIEENSKKGATGKSSYENILDSFLIRLESEGGIEKLFSFYTGFLKFDISKEINKDLYRKIKILFSLRNILAHGTTLVEADPETIDQNNEAFFKQQKTLEEARKLLNQLYGEDDFLKNLSHFELPKYFMSITQEFLKEFKDKFGAKYCLSEDDSRFLDKIIKYSWGYMLV
ncbi:hypothetical protein [Acinetobacter sp.]|uniref:hypothetical protein n=1 Tax=Acinetobacter sp. TaxID=472 RepID=UPI0028A870F9|nr:hypothetical protein [Acinetobacter sp.]